MERPLCASGFLERELDAETSREAGVEDVRQSEQRIVGAVAGLLVGRVVDHGDVVEPLEQIGAREVDGGTRLSAAGAGAAIQAGKPAASRLLIEDVQSVEFEADPLDLAHLEGVRHQHVGLGEERRAAHAAAAFHEDRDLVDGLHHHAQRRAAAGVLEDAEFGGVGSVDVELLAPIQLEDMGGPSPGGP